MDRIKQIANEKDAKQKINEALAKDLSELKFNYNATLTELKHIKQVMNETINNTQEQIDQINEKIKEIDQAEKNITGMTGLSGQTLIQCLASVRAFAQSLQQGTTVYSPLVSILKGLN